jgi:transcriptional regulator with XRE-family HTH domain
MDNKTEVRDFLATRRARITPEQAGLPVFGGNRRVKGLRREEVAMLAGVSVDYYVRLERGTLAGVSESVLEAVSRALQLDDVERMHLFDLARIANSSVGSRRVPSTQRIRPTVQRLLDSIDGPAWVRNSRTDFLASNLQGRALYSQIFFDPARRPNSARFAFLDPRSREFYPEWERIADGVVASLRAEAGRNPFDKGLTDLIGELSTRSEDFRVRWAQHDVYRHRAGSKRFHHPIVGDLELSFEAMELTMDPGLTLLAYSAEPGSASAQALQLLASWAETELRARPVEPADAP